VTPSRFAGAALDLGAHLHAQLGVEVGQRLVEQEHLGIAHDRAAHRDALALAARQLRGLRSSSSVSPRIGGFVDPLVA
jgi:hypothetical protein